MSASDVTQTLSSGIAPGTRFADRFVVESLAGSGAMGTVFRARDAITTRLVALKVMRVTGDIAVERFEREAELLAGLRHPGIVGHVAHGVTTAGEPYLALEWLEGIELRAHLERARPGVPEAVAMVKRVADALAVAHERGIVHRDIKPSNLFLRDGELGQVTLLDFGIAQSAGAKTLTHTGALIGTPMYMSPEQARGDPDVGPAADVFALGCVLFECLTGRPPFFAEQVAAVLTKILFDAAPRLSDVRPGLSAALGELQAAMLAKDPRARPRDAAALSAVISSLPPLDEEGSFEPARTPPAIAAAERQIVCVLLAVPPPGAPPPPSTAQALLVRFGADAARLADGSIAGTWVQKGDVSAREQAVRAARGALRLHDLWPAARISLSTGRGVVSGQVTLGDAIERAASLARLDVGMEGAGPGVLVDSVTASLLEGRCFVKRVAENAFVLEREHTQVPMRKFLGKQTPFVGRDRELATIEMAFSACADESQAVAVIVMAPPGLGKSRLAVEALQRMLAGRPLTVLAALGDSINSGSSYAMLAEALRRLAGVVEGDERGVQEKALRSCVGQYVKGRDGERVSEFLGELCGVPFSDEGSLSLRSARQDGQLMADRMSEAFVDLLRAQAAVQPTLLLLEDLHWADPLTIHLVDAALRELAGERFIVLAFGRPEVEDAFPHLWSNRNTHEIRLKGLSQRAGERLVREILGAELPAETVRQIVQHADGNPLYLEELIRARADGREDHDLPETVLAMVEARLARLDGELRRVLRAASVFGGTFWKGGVERLLGIEPGSHEVDRRLETLEAAEVIVAERESRFRGESQFRMYHALMREAAYAMLTDDDRRAGHRCAGEFLEQAGEHDPVVLAEHFRLGEDLERAASCYSVAADQALRKWDLDGAVARAERGVECKASGETLGNLRASESWAYVLQMDYANGSTYSFEALPLVRPGSVHWCRALGTACLMLAVVGDEDRIDELATSIESTDPDPEAVTEYIDAISKFMMALTRASRREVAVRMVKRIEQVAPGDALAQAWLNSAYIWTRRNLELDPYGAYLGSRETLAAIEGIQDRRIYCLAKMYYGEISTLLGAREEGLESYRDCMTECVRIGFDACLEVVHGLSAYALATAWNTPEAWREAEDLAVGVVTHSAENAYFRGYAHAALSVLASRAGDGARAKQEAASAMKSMRSFGGLVLIAYAASVDAHLTCGEVEQARKVAEEGLVAADSVGGIGICEVRLRVVAAEARMAAGDDAAARAALAEALRQLDRRAASLPDAPLLERFRTRVPENARARALADSWGLGREATPIP